MQISISILKKSLEKRSALSIKTVVVLKRTVVLKTSVFTLNLIQID